MAAFSFLVSICCLAAIIEGRKKPMGQVLPMIIAFLAWSGFTWMEWGIENDPTHPNIRLDIIFIIPLGIFSLLAFAVYSARGPKPDSDPVEEEIDSLPDFWLWFAPPIIGFISIYVFHVLLAFVLGASGKYAFEMNYRRMLFFELLPYWGLTAHLATNSNRPRKALRKDMLNGLLGSMACLLVVTILAAVSLLFRISVSGFTPLFCALAGYWSLRIDLINKSSALWRRIKP